MASQAKANARRCDDAFAFSADGRFAIADGTSSCGVVPGDFAQFLVDQFTLHSSLSEIDRAMTSPQNFKRWVQHLAPEWERILDEIVRLKGLQWTAQAWLDGEPTGCTFACLRLVEHQGGTPSMNLIVAGDAAVFSVHEQRIDRFRQKEKAAAGLVGVTNGIQLQRKNPSNVLIRPPLHSHGVRLKPGSYVVLATDAVADWIEACCDSTNAPMSALESLLTLRSQTDFERWVSERCREFAAGGGPELPEDDKAIISLRVLPE
jgi:hypothetical protein